MLSISSLKIKCPTPGACDTPGDCDTPEACDTPEGCDTPGACDTLSGKQVSAERLSQLPRDKETVHVYMMM